MRWRRLSVPYLPYLPWGTLGFLLHCDLSNLRQFTSVSCDINTKNIILCRKDLLNKIFNIFEREREKETWPERPDETKLKREIKLQSQKVINQWTNDFEFHSSYIVFHDFAVLRRAKVTGTRSLSGRIDSLSIDETSACRCSTKIPAR